MFFRICWVLQLLVGFGLFSVSLILEWQVLNAFFSLPFIAIVLAISLEGGKAISIIWHRYLSTVLPGYYGMTTRLVSNLFRIGLIVFSIVCSQIFLASYLDRPYLEEIRVQDITQINNQFSRDLNRVTDQQEKALAAIEATLAREYEDRSQYHQKTLAMLEKQVADEMNNVVKGTYIGPRYRDYRQRLAEAKQAASAEMTALSQQYRADIERLTNQHQASVNRITKEKNSALNAVRQSTYATDDRVNHPLIVSTLELTRTVFPNDLKPLEFVFIFSLLLSLIIEMGIYLSFETITAALIPALVKNEDNALNSIIGGLDKITRSLTRNQKKRHREAINEREAA